MEILASQVPGMVVFGSQHEGKNGSREQFNVAALLTGPFVPSFKSSLTSCRGSTVAGKRGNVQQTPLQTRAGRKLTRMRAPPGWWPELALAAGVGAYVSWWRASFGVVDSLPGP